ncbi:efflux RND transporter periplasmic adaptor subunit [Hymenobacter gummosus]|uniref:Efflux RND transporter periplasmic adaptor subunit n=1 Tax=Hymenobacter gummosus TaxID=1776032 RepID=A0A431U4D2_9BACT|nr:efflux RND transporter periplasmic adaptor subunit [Hymenobacter gummosus]RTQ50755.1 efflux RND transporter periplasmic adaptor subunit [Hymenobacter gummosus]
MSADKPDKPSPDRPDEDDAPAGDAAGQPRRHADEHGIDDPAPADDHAAPDPVNHNEPGQAIKDHMRFGENPVSERKDEPEDGKADPAKAGADDKPDETGTESGKTQKTSETDDKPEEKDAERQKTKAAEKPKQESDAEKTERESDAQTEPKSDDEKASGQPKPRSKRRFWLVASIVGGLFVVLLLVGIIPRIKKNQERKKAARATLIAKPVVRVQPAVKAPDTTRLELSANTRANRETYIFARVDGYVEAWYADIGARVRKGQLLALIATPELDQRVTEARANAELARTSYNRLRSVVLPGAISRQELDQGRAQYEAQRAVLNQLLAQRNFRRVTAPFSGIVTERNVELGGLIAVSNAEGSQLYKLAQTDTLRAFVNVPQSFTPSIRRGLGADVIVPEFPDKPFPGRVSRDAGALAPDTRTLLTEVKVPNPREQLKPGVFALVRFRVPRTAPSVVISANALVPSGLEPRVVVVRNQKVYYQPIEPGRDFGDEVEVTKGLKGGELLVINPSETLRDGLAVEVRRAEAGKDNKGKGKKDKPEGPEPLYEPDRPRQSLPVDKQPGGPSRQGAQAARGGSAGESGRGKP